MNRHHLRFVLRQYVEHKNPENLRLQSGPTARVAGAHDGALAGAAPPALAVPMLGGEPGRRVRRPLGPLLAAGGRPGHGGRRAR